MATIEAEPDPRFPVFELTYSDTARSHVTSVRSTDGMLLVRVPGGGAFRSISARIVSSPVALRLKYRCTYTRVGLDADRTDEAIEGEQCPQEAADAITRIAFESKIYYRCWVARAGGPDTGVQDPAGTFWYPSGQFCGTAGDGSWITALEIKVPPIIEGWRSAAASGHELTAASRTLLP